MTSVAKIMNCQKKYLFLRSKFPVFSLMDVQTRETPTRTIDMLIRLTDPFIQKKKYVSFWDSFELFIEIWPGTCLSWPIYVLEECFIEKQLETSKQICLIIQ
jgi:hypothetical protein